MNSQEKEQGKKAAGLKAVDYVQEGMRLGLGTGSTVFYFLEGLKERGLRIEGLASSQKTIDLARQFGLPLLDPEKVSELDLTVDGADEIDSKKQMIKGGGGALLREKIVAAMSKRMIVIVDSQKVVKELGAFALPLEVLPFGILATVKHLEKLGYLATIRKTKSDNGNFLVDIKGSLPILHAKELDSFLKSIPGVLETGLFFDLAETVVVGYPDGKTQVL